MEEPKRMARIEAEGNKERKAEKEKQRKKKQILTTLSTSFTFLPFHR